MSGAERAKYLYRIARIIQERGRELAVLESIDNGKPIKESRDVDIPVVAAHFFYYAGWADKLEHSGYGSTPLGVAGQIIPWNFPLLMLAWKIAPALACGNTVVLKPAETTPLTALLFAEICQQADLPPGVVNIVTGAGDTGRAIVSHPDVDKVAFTGSTEVGKAIARSVAGTDKKVTLELGGKAANIVFDDAPLDQAVEGIVNGIFFNQGHVCCAGSRLLVQESVADEVLERLKRRMSTLRVGDPLDKNTDVGAINSAEQLDQDPRAVRDRRGRGRRALVGRVRPPRRTASGSRRPLFTGVTQAHRIAREEIFGPVLSVLTFRTPSEAVEKANNTPVRPLGRRVDRQGLAHPVHGQPPPGRRRLGQHVQQVRPHLAVRRLQGVRLRPRGRPPRARGLPEGSGQLMSRIDVRKTYKLYIGGQFPRSESGRSYVVNDAKGRLLANAAQASRKDARDAVVAARAAFGGWSGEDGLQPRPDRLPHRRGAGGSARAVRGRAARVRGRHRRPRPGRYVDAAIDRLVWYAGWADKITQVVGNANPVAGPYFNLSTPEPSGVIAVVAPSGPLLGLVSVVAPLIITGNTVVVIASEENPLTAITLGEVMATSDLPGGVVNVLTGSVAEIAPWLASHMDVNGIDLTGVTDADLADRARGGRGRQPQARTPPRLPTPTGSSSPPWTG